jgi:beta-glucuronidase
VIAWSLANEPGYLGEAIYASASAPYWAEVFAHARALDPTRPLTLAQVQYAGEADPAFGLCDFLSVNRYYGWYTEPGQLERATVRLRELFDRLSAVHGKPIFVSEFGADAIAGFHATTDQLWTEDFQSDFIEAYWREILAHPAVIGGHVWNFADFRTAQHGRRAVLNHKGVFTRQRDPKRAAFTVRRLWRGV